MKQMTLGKLEVIFFIFVGFCSLPQILILQ